MGRRKKFIVPEIAKKYQKQDFAVLPDGKIIEKDELIKVKGEHGLTFQFTSFVTNLENGKEWIDCIEIYRGRQGAIRSFYIESVKKLPKRRGKRVRRAEDS